VQQALLTDQTIAENEQRTLDLRLTRGQITEETYLGLTTTSIQKHATVRTGIYEAEAERQAALVQTSGDKSAAAVIAADKSMTDQKKKLTMSTLEYHLDAVDMWVAEQLKNTQVSAADYSAFSKKVIAESNTRRQGLLYDVNFLKDNSIKKKQEEADYQKRTLDQMLANEKEYSKGVIREQKERAKESQTVADIASGKKGVGAQLGIDLTSSLKSAALQMPAILAQVVGQGGSMADVAKAGGSLFGGLLGTKMGETLGKNIGGMVGQFMGPLGSMLGSMVGPMIDKVADALHKSGGEDVVGRVGKEWGIKITEEMGDAIDKNAKDMFKGMRNAAETFNISKLIEAGGGLQTKNIDMFTSKLRDTFTYLQTGVYSTADATKVLNDNFGKFTAYFKGGVISTELREIVALTKAEGLEVESVTKFLGEMSEKIRKGFSGIVAGAMGILPAEMGKYKDAVKSVTAAEKELGNAQQQEAAAK
jgi:hypothetical protein